MPLSELPPPVSTDPDAHPGQELPLIHTPPPGPMSRSWAARLARVECDSVFQPSDEPQPPPIVYATSYGSNIIDVDGNRYVDLAASFGAVLLGHNAPRTARSLECQLERTWTGLGDVFPTDAKVGMLERVVSLYPKGGARALLCQSGSDAITAAIKTAVLCTGKKSIIAFRGAYHGMGYAALSACGYRESFRAPFVKQLNPNVHFAPYPHHQDDVDASLQTVQNLLESQDVAAILVEPILGRGGCIEPPPCFLPELSTLAHDKGALLIADEIWTGLGRCGAMLACYRVDVVPDILCLGKGLGGGLAISACLGSEKVMDAWKRNPGVVHTSTFQANPLACATGTATIDFIRLKKLDERAKRVGNAFQSWLRTSLEPFPAIKAITGAGLMVGITFDSGATVNHIIPKLLHHGYIAISGGMDGECLTLTPSLTIEEDLLEAFVDTLAKILAS